MADNVDDVLELDVEAEVQEDGADTEPQSDGEGGDEDSGDVPFIGFADEEEAAPASESDNSVIREMRRVAREQAKRIAELEREQAPQKVEVGEKPTLESCDYDEERFEASLTSYHERKAQADREAKEAQATKDKERTEWEQRHKAYEADKGKLGVPDFDDAEGEVFAALPQETAALIMLTDKPAALIYALSRNPSKLKELSELNLAKAAMTIGKLEDKLTMGTRKPPQPDRPVTGNAAPANADKELARLEKEANRTGDRTALIQYRQKLKSRA